MPEQSTTDNSIFEALFQRALKVDQKFAEDLRRIGYDPVRPEPKYPTVVFERALDVAHRHAFPGLSPQEADWRLGGLLSENWFETLLGKVVAVGLPLLGAERVVATLPRRFKMGADVGCAVEKLGDRHWVVKLEDGTRPELVAGALEAALKRTRVAPTLRVEGRGAQGCSIVITWVDA